MKNRHIITLLLLIFTVPMFAQKAMDMKAEEAAVKKVITDETMYYMTGNYEKWAECVANDPMTNFSWATPFAGKNDVMELKGWDQVSAFYKKEMEGNTMPEDGLPKVDNFQYKISGNMAFVTYMQDDRSSETRVLEKKDGKWRILRMEATASKAFKRFHQLYALQRMAGTWELDLASYKEEGGGDWKLLGGVAEAKATDYGLSWSEHYDYRNADGEYRSSKEKGMMALNMGTDMVSVMFASVYPNSKWTRSGTGTGTIDENGVLHFKGQRPGGKDIADVKYWMEGDDMHYAMVVKNPEGEQVYASSYKMTRKGLNKVMP